MSVDPHPNHDRRCCLCERTGRRSTMIPAEVVRPQIAQHMAAHFGDRWTGSGYVCRECLNVQRLDFVTSRLTEEKGQLSDVEREVAKKAGLHLTIARDIDAQFQRDVTFGQRAADAVARVGGSWTFVLGFMVFIVAWMIANTLALRHGSFDPYPYILLNLVLSCLAALQAPVILMSQNRQTERDRVESSHDYETDLKAEIEIASMHDKLDHLLHAQWERMVELQQMQIDLLTEIAGRSRGR
jgi:uncharacterized membrane protein